MNAADINSKEEIRLQMKAIEEVRCAGRIQLFKLEFNQDRYHGKLVQVEESIVGIYAVIKKPTNFASLIKTGGD